MTTIGFLHTADVHVGTFRRLLRELGPGCTDVHVVDESLLADARERGVDGDVERRLLGRLREVAARRPDVIVCTCSTLGGHAERMGAAVGVPVLRVDRPMAEAAVAAGARIGVVASTASTLGPTCELLASCARPGTEIVEAPCLDAWPLFLASDFDGYAHRVAEHARTLDVDVVVLAQASMAGAEQLLADLGRPVFCSPRIAVRRTLEDYTTV
ncbi:aspartate/glutamate racemase family protein [Couchioplanes caeruleus]|uniref:aspartate/glutamate racemase family protein n=1 Tax=Couchioplanes caeruleus TaxID=56438 RepID=UPI0020BE318D|nr:aspartate/glutamate racemase family protein [Couchioplanes caeruleus]UQU64380.1 aspartate/glutamate racemase family protein [Couchioplanes caeruleus]